MKDNIKKPSTLKEDEIIVFTLGDLRKNAIRSIILKDKNELEIMIYTEEEKFIENRYTDKTIISFNGSSYDIPLWKKYNHPQYKNHIDLYPLCKKYIHLELPNYKMTTISKHFGEEVSPLSLKSMNELYDKEDYEELKKALIQQIEVRYSIYFYLQNLMKKHSFKFTILKQIYFLTPLNFYIKKDFLYLEYLSDKELPLMEYHFDSTELLSQSEKVLILKTPVYEGNLEEDRGKAIKTQFARNLDSSLVDPFYLVERNGVLLKKDVLIWAKQLFDYLDL